ncbi:MAG: hypothetical protein K9M57_02700 [Phycisphaerae bacterium]|nr:hypothetical protein [Phycisphaerae bacterium]
MHILLWQIIIAADGEKKLLDPQNILWVVGIVLLSFFMLKATQRRMRRSQRDMDLSVKERMARKVKVQSDSSNQMTELMASLADLSRQINGQIDTRVAKLEILLDRADQTIARMDKHDDAHPVSKQDHGQGESVSQSQEAKGKRADKKNSRANRASTRDSALPENQAESTEKPKSPPQPFPVLSDDAKYVLGLLESGMSKVNIAKTMDRPVGEIELILSLAGKKV